MYALSDPLVIVAGPGLLWDADTLAADAQDGDGTWIAGGDNWWDGLGNLAWDNAAESVAEFGAGNATADPTVTVDAVTAGGITFNDAGGYKYTLTGGTITLAGGAATIVANVDARIESVIAGTAEWVKTGAGTLEVTGANSYTGGVSVAGGTLVGDTGSILGDVALSNASNVTFNQESDGSYDGRITGEGSVTKTGAGTLELTSYDHAYTGDLTVSAGALLVTGSLPGDSTMTVEAGGTLAGSGGVGVVDLYGTVAPGASIGTLYAAGAVTFNAGAAYEWEVNKLDGGTAGSDWDLLHVLVDLIVSATSEDPFTIKVISLTSLGDPGTADGTLEEGDSFEIARASPIDGFSADKFTIDTTAFQNPMAGLEFVVVESGGSLYLDVVTLDPVILASLTITEGSAWDGLAIDSPFVLSEVTGTLAVEDGASLTLAGGTISVGVLDVARGGTVSGHGTVSGPIDAEALSMLSADGGDLILGDSTGYDGFSTEGTLVVGANSVTLHAKGFANLGILTELDGGTLAAPNGVYVQGGGALMGYGTVSGRIATAAGSTIEATGDLGLGDITRLDGVDLDGALAVGTHTVTLNDANEAVLGSLTTIEGGKLEAPNGLLLPEGHNIVGAGEVAADLKTQGYVHGNEPGLDLSGHVTGRGDFGGNVIFSNTYEPGSSTATISMENVTFTASAVLGIELDDGANDRLEISGDLTADGRLALSLINGFAPAEGEEFEIITFGSGRSAGRFSEVTGWGAVSGLALAPFYEDTSVKLVVELRGDADENDVVELSDIVVAIRNWQATGEEATWVGGDVNLDGIVNLSDIVEMISNWQATPPAGGMIGSGEGQTPVPEPATLALLALGACLPLFQRRRR